MVTKKVKIDKFKAGGEACDCLRPKWGAHRLGYCPLHGPNKKDTLHDRVSRRFIESFGSVHKECSFLPQCCVRRFGSRRGKHYLDVVVVTREGTVLAVEVDGRSHSNKRARKYDNEKNASLRSFSVKLERIGLQDDWETKIQQIQTDVTTLNVYAFLFHLYSKMRTRNPSSLKFFASIGPSGNSSAYFRG